MGMRGGPRVAFVPAVSMLHRSFNSGPRRASRLMLPVASASTQFAPGPTADAQPIRGGLPERGLVPIIGVCMDYAERKP